MIDKNHFRWRDLKPMLVEQGWHNSVAEIERMESEIVELVRARDERMQELLADVKYNHQTGAHKAKFRPCHKRRLDDLKVTTEFWLV